MLGKKKYLLLLILIIAVLLLTSGCLYYYPVVYTLGSIEITTNPPGAKIFFDGTDTGYITPNTLTNVSAGNHIIKLTLTDYVHYSNVINVIANQTTEINLNLTPVIPSVFLIRISVLPSTMNLAVGESQNINSVTAYYSDSSTADISLANCTYEPYHTYDPSYTSVNSSGLITGISAGTALILVTYTEGIISKTDTVTVNVTTAPITPDILSYIKVLPSTMNLSVEESQTINSVTAYYDNASTANINLTACSYSSSNTACATVNGSGTIIAASEGTAVITVSYTEGGITKADTVEVTVSAVVQNEIVYRALCVGVGDYINYGSDGDLLAPPYDVDRIKQLFSYCKFGSSNTGFSTINYLKNWQATKSNILQSISSTFSGADSNDISYFYFSGHGSRVGNTSYICPADITSFVSTAISVDELESALSAIPGTKVVFLDSCHSGGFIGKGREEIIVSREELESFNNEVINIFSQAQPKGLLTTNQYKVLTSCHYYQVCWEIHPEESDPFGVFTMALCDGCGYSGSYPADTNLDTKVSLQEAYLYVRDWVFYYGVVQDVQVYPNNSTFTIVEY
ncbi:caspase family protein [bacterium]|nr:caspase family protein [bacterium]